MSTNNHINYIELYANNLSQVKDFYSSVFKWKFQDYGPNYTAFSASGLEGGFEKTDQEIVNGALVVLFHSDLESTLQLVSDNGGRISKEIFSFPGGQRFEFFDPSGNLLAVWRTTEE